MTAFLGVIALWMLTACAIGQVVNHSFGFDTRRDGQDALILDYRYGTSKLPVRAPEAAVQRGETFTFNSVTGPMVRGDSLYVKWRIKTTGQIYEDTVDLRNRLPEDITDHKVYFMVKGSQLIVYLIPPDTKKRPPNKEPTGPRAYSHLDVVTIYPDQAKH